MLVLGLSSLQGRAQENPKLFAALDIFRNKSFIGNTYLGLNVGSQLFQWHFLAPEVGYEYHFGRLRERQQVNPQDPNYQAPSKFRSRFSSHSFSLAPKLIFGNEEAALVLIPQYNWGKITATGQFLEASGRRYQLVESQQVSNPINFWSFAAGVEGDLFNSDLLHFSLLVKYHLLNSEESLWQLDLESTGLQPDGGSADGLGLSFRVYLDLLDLL